MSVPILSFHSLEFQQERNSLQYHRTMPSSHSGIVFLLPSLISPSQTISMNPFSHFPSPCFSLRLELCSITTLMVFLQPLFIFELDRVSIILLTIFPPLFTTFKLDNVSIILLTIYHQLFLVSQLAVIHIPMGCLIDPSTISLPHSRI